MDFMMLYLQTISKSLILTYTHLSLLNFSSEFPVPCWIFPSKHSIGTLCAITENLILLNCSFCD